MRPIRPGPTDDAPTTPAAVFNTNELCNPGKLFPTAKSCVEVKWRPRAAYV